MGVPHVAARSSLHVIAVLVAALLLQLAASPGIAAVAIVPTVEQLAAKSSVIFIGSVESFAVVAAHDVSIETVYQVRVLNVLKGSVDDAIVEIAEPGGILEERWLAVDGTPRYEAGERYLVFANRDPSGRMHTVDMAAGSFRFGMTAGGVPALERDLSGIVDIGGNAVAEAPEPADDLLRRVVAQATPANPSSKSPGSTFPNASGLSILTAAQTAAASWTNESLSDVVYTISSALPAGNAVDALDGEDRIIEDDPNSVVSGTFDGTGIIAAAFVGGTGTHTFDSTTFDTITGADIVTNDGVSSTNLSQGDFATVIARELGRTLGFRNSDKNETGIANCTAPLPCSSAAVMSSVLMPSVNATLQNWDLDAVRAMYGTTGGSTNYAGKLPSATNHARRAGGRGDFIIAAAGASFRKTVTWTSATGGNWSDASKWDLGVPATGDDVVISRSESLTVVLDTSAIVHSLTLGSGSGADTLQVPNYTLTVDTGTLVVGANGTLEVSGGTLTGSGLVQIAGAMNWSGGTISGNGTLEILADGSMGCTGTGTLTISRPLTSQGAFLRSGTGGTTQVLASFTNAGTISVASGSTILFSGTTTLTSASSVSGAGNVTFSGATTSVDGTYTVTGTTTVTAGTFTLSVPPTAALVMSGGDLTTNATSISQLTLTGGTLRVTAALTIGTSFTWSYGTLCGAGSTTVSAAATLNLVNGGYDGPRYLDGHTLSNQGSAIWNDVHAYYIYPYHGLALTNAAVIHNSGTFTMQKLAGFATGAGTFSNTGTLTIAGPSSPSFGIAFVNAGSVIVQAGTPSLSGGTNCSGTISVASGSTLVFYEGTTTLTAASNVSGAGGVTFSSATTSVDGTYNVTGTTTVTAGTFALSVPPSGSLVMSGGTLTLNAPTVATIQMGGGDLTTNATSISQLTLTGGTLRVTAALTIGTSFTWSYGTLCGAGSTTVSAAATLNLVNGGYDYGPRYLDGHTLSNQGSAIWNDVHAYYVYPSNGLALSNAAVIHNSGTFTTQKLAGFPAGAGTFDNTGTLTIAGPSGPSFGIAFANAGSVIVQAGTLSLAGSSTNSGLLQAAIGATLVLTSVQQSAAGTIRVDGTLSGASGTFSLDSGILTGTGNVTGTLVNNAEVRPGNSAGTLTVANYTQTAAGQLTLDLGGLDPALNDHLVVTGTATLAGRLHIVQAPGFTSFVGDVFPVIAYGSHSGTFSLVSGNGLSGQKSLNPSYEAAQMTLRTGSTPAPSIGTIDPTFGSTFGGDAFTLTGTNFMDGATVKFGTALATSVVVINSSTLSGVTPPNAAGLTAIVVANTDGQSITAYDAFDYIAPPPPPTIVSIDPPNGPTTGGTSITIHGTNFQEGATLTIDGRVPDMVTVVDASTITARTLPRSPAAVDVTVTNPASVVTHPGGRSVTLAGGFTYACATPTTPALLTPAAGALDVPLSTVLAWNVNAGDFRYDVILDTSASPAYVYASNVAANIATGTNAMPISVRPATTYYWKIVAKGDPDCTTPGESSSVVRSFTTEGSCGAPGPFDVNSPTNGAIGVGSSIQLSWNAAQGAFLYDVYLGPSNPPAFFDSTIGTTLGANNLVAGTTYYWSVVARAACDDHRITSTPVRTFTIQGGCGAPGTFTLTSPADGATSTSTAPTLTWTASANASAYDLYLGMAADPPLILTDFPKQSISVAGLQPGVKYYWKLVAKAGCNATLTVTSPIVSFTTGTGCTAPSSPSFTFTPPGSVGIGQTYALAWRVADGIDSGGSYVIERSTDGEFTTILDAQTTRSTSTTFIADAVGTYYHRVRAIQGCDSAQRSGYSSGAAVTVVKGRPSVIFTVQPEAVLTTLGDDLATKKTRFVLENLAPDPVTVIVGRQEINSTPFFTWVDPAGSDGFLTLLPRTPKELEIHFSGPSPTVSASYQGIIFLASIGAQLNITPYAFVNLKVGGEASVTPQFIVDDAIAQYAAFAGWSGDDATRPPRSISIRNPGTAPMELGAEIGPEVWLVPEAGWNATPIPAGGVRTFNLSTQRNRAPAGSGLPRYTYFTIRTRDGKTARLLVQDNDAASIGSGRANALDAGASSIIVPDVLSEVATTGLPLATQVRMTNLGTEAVQADLYFTPSGADGFSTSVKRTTVIVPPNDVVTLTDPLAQLFNLSRPARGQLEIRASQERIGSLLVDASIVSTRGDRLLIARSETVPRGTGVRSGDPHRLPGITKSTTRATALLLAETTGIGQATVNVRLYDAAGVIKGNKNYTVKRYGHVREADIVATLGGGATLVTGQLEITTTAGAGVVVGIAEVLDANGESRSTIVSRSASTGAAAQLRLSKDGRPETLSGVTTTVVVPVVVSGQVDPVSGSGYKTPMSFTTPAPTASGVVTFTSVTGSAYQQTLNLVANVPRTFNDVLSELFGRTSGDRGSISATFDAPVYVVANIQTAGAVPLEGNTVVEDVAAASSSPLYVDGLDQPEDGTKGNRWNLYVTNSSATPGSVTVRLYESGGRLYPIEQRSFAVAANSQLALESLFGAMGLTTVLRFKDRPNVLCNVTPDGGGAIISAVAVGVSNESGEVAVRPLKEGSMPASSVSTVGFAAKFPQIESFSPLSGPVGTQVVITGSGFEETRWVHFNATQQLVFTTNGDTQITTTVPPGATDGPITVTTPGGATSSTAWFTVTGGVPVPSITGFMPTSGGVGTTVTITGTGFGGTSAVTFNGVSANYTPGGDAQVTATVPAGATTGKIAVTTQGGTATSASDFTVIPAPSITSFTPPSGPVGTNVTINGTGLTGVTAVTFNGVAADDTPVSDVQITATVPSGATTGKIAVTTPGGTATSATDFTVIPAPSITGFTPTSGPVGTSVTITGTGLTGATSVTFGGGAADYTPVTDTQVTATVPPSATTGKIAVTTPGGIATSATDFTVIPAPSITGFTPTSGSVGTSVTINGTGLTGVTAVTFNGVAANYTPVSDTQITATVPPSATTGKIAVTTPGGIASSATDFTVVALPPSITSFTPASGPPGTTVTISGVAFTGATSVTFAGTSAQFTVVSDTTISAIVPADALTGRIVVTTEGGTATSSTDFTIPTGPVITSFTPASGPEGTIVTIHGSGFANATAVRFNGISATFIIDSDTQITATVPLDATTGKISVVTPAGSAVSDANFVVGALPPGDSNGDGTIDASDVIYLLNYLLAGGPAPSGSGDVNGDSIVDMVDVFYLINYLFGGGPAPH